MFLLVPTHPGCPGQFPQSRKTVVCVCMYASILYHFEFIAHYWSKVAYFDLPQLHLVPPLGMTPFEFCRDLNMAVCVILHLAVLTQYLYVMDGQTHDS